MVNYRQKISIFAKLFEQGIYRKRPFVLSRAISNI